ncbi:hypothetical protein JVU11DRAFT_11685 [Chiua virens]|nr:hypothetical protein JVU11DRAFT_11685 [Chiua virens]
MPSPPFPPRPAPTPSHQDDPRLPSNSPSRPYPSQNDPRSILRPSPTSPHNPSTNPQPPPIPRSITTTSSPYHHHHTSSSPELRPRADNTRPPRVRPYTQQHLPDLSQPANTSAPTHTSSHFIPRPRPGQDNPKHALVARLNLQSVPGNRGRSASDVRIVHTPPPDLEPDRLARACGQPAHGAYRLNDRARQGDLIDSRSSRSKDPEADPSPSHPPVPKIRVGHMYRRLDALARRHGHRAMDYVSIEDIAAIHKHDSQLREQLRRKRSDRLQERDPTFHAIGATLEDVFLHASTTIVIGDHQHHLPVVVVACIEELTKTGYGLFRALPSRDRHLQLIDLFDKSSDFGAQFNMRGQAMPDICALLSTFISSLPSPLLDVQIYSALWHWSVKPSVKREDARRDRQEEEEEARRARGELPRSNSWMRHTDLYLDDADIALESDQISIAQILLRFLPLANLSLLVYLSGGCGSDIRTSPVGWDSQGRITADDDVAIDTLASGFGLFDWETCGMTPPPSPSRGGASEAEGNRERIEKRKGERDSGSEDASRNAMPSSSSSPSTDSP